MSPMGRNGLCSFVANYNVKFYESDIGCLV